MIHDPVVDYDYTRTRRYCRRVWLLVTALACFAGAACLGAAWVILGA